MPSSCGAIASNARPTRSSFNVSGTAPKTSSTAHSRAQSSTRNNGVGDVKRFAISVSITCPWVSLATLRTGQSRSIVPATSRRRQNSATTGNDPSVFSTLGGP